MLCSVSKTWLMVLPASLSPLFEKSGCHLVPSEWYCSAKNHRAGPPQVLHKQPYAGGGYQWFSPAPYSQPASGFGTCSIGSVYGPGEQNIDASITKSFPIFHQQNIEFRAEFINAFNHTILDAPNTNLGPTLGVINQSQYARNIQIAFKYNF